MSPKFDLDKIKYATDKPTFERAIGIYESDGVKDFQDTGFSYTAKVRGSQDKTYDVVVSPRTFDSGMCNCYLGQNNTLCKHMVAVAIYAVLQGRKMDRQYKEYLDSPVCSGKLGELKQTELIKIKTDITSALKCIKAYIGPSRTWFTYQNSLCEGCYRLTAIVSQLPVSSQTAKILVDLLLRLGKKLCMGGVDDSDGTVGGFMEAVVDMLKKYAELDTKCIEAFKTLKGRETCFGWEEQLVKLIF